MTRLPPPAPPRGHKSFPRSSKSGQHSQRQSSSQSGGGTANQGRLDLLWGLHAVRAALTNPARRVHTVLTSHADLYTQFLDDMDKWVGLIRPHAGPPAIQHVTADHLRTRIPPQAVHQGIIAYAAPLEPISLESLCPNKGFVLALDEVVDPQNVGALWRSAAAFGAQAILLTKNNSPAVDGTLTKAACGGCDVTAHVRVTNLVSALDKLRQKGFFVVGLAEGGASLLHEVDLWPAVLVVGAEATGLRRLTRTCCDLIATIQTQPNFSTLNASASGAIAMHHFACHKRFL
jgi:23S rRNA (guanosine2251-2'-O)-methyltransferase